MAKRTTRLFTGVIVCWGCFPVELTAQQPRPEDVHLDAMRGLATIGSADQRRIAEWVERRVDQLSSAVRAAKAHQDPEAVKAARNKAFVEFRDRVLRQFRHAGNSSPFSTQLVVQTTQVAVKKFGDVGLDGVVAWALSRVLVDMRAPQTVTGLLAGLQSKSESARFTCARGLTELRNGLAGNKGVLTGVVRAVVAAGLIEASPVVLSHLYRVIAVPAQTAEVFDAFMSLFDKRLDYRRGPAVRADGAELEALRFFRTSSVLNALSPTQKSQVVGRVAVFLRMDAERYNTPGLQHDERIKLEMSMEAAESILAALVSGRPSGIAKELQRGGHEKRADILAKVYEWVGDPQSQQAGALGAAPWNVPIGAP